MDPAEILDGEWKQTREPHRFLVVERSYAPGHRHGSISVADSLPPEEGWSRLALLAGSAVWRQPAVRRSRDDGPCRWRRQLRISRRMRLVQPRTLSRPPVPAFELCVRARAARSRDETSPGRWTPSSPTTASRSISRSSRRATRLNRLTTPFADMPHVDMLHHARRLWHGARRGPSSQQPRIVAAWSRARRRCARDSRSPRAISTTCAPAMRGRSTRCSSTTVATCCRWRC